MTEKVTTVLLHINPILLRDAKLVAAGLEIETDRFLTELVESAVATWRLNKAIPTAKSIREKKNQRVN